MVPLAVGVLTLPFSIIADRWGRVKSIALMAALWSVATLGCAIASSYHEMFIARIFVGVGEAAYGSVGLAMLMSIFPKHLRSTIAGGFTSAAAFGSVLGVSLSGIVATHFGWRWSMGLMAIFGFVLVIIYFFVVTEKRLARAHPDNASGTPVYGACETDTSSTFLWPVSVPFRLLCVPRYITWRPYSLAVNTTSDARLMPNGRSGLIIGPMGICAFCTATGSISYGPMTEVVNIII